PPGKHLAGGHLWRGSPVKKIRPLSSKDYQLIEDSATQYILLKNEYLATP
ncbi:MAG: gamma carbonic anhydrase family protein, partial [Bdellovibrionales bacterium]|nr:gamma carbonic anhydrase family protein [Bdellovibrionales bacterium]